MRDIPLEDLFESDVRVASAPIADHVDALCASERAALAPTVLPHRLAEFSTGRLLAHRLLVAAGVADPKVDRGPDRAPLWPAGWQGSITHSGDRCAVAIASTRAYAGIGLDLEPDLPVREGLERMICFGEELAWLAAGGDDVERRRRCRMVFSAKEAVYKAFYPRVRRVWRFSEVALAIDLEQGDFRARLPDDAGRPEIEGRIRVARGWIVSGVAIALGESPAP